MPRRSLAQEFCDAGLVEVNGAVAKSSKEVKGGDTISINRKDRTTKMRIDSIPERKQVARSAASDLFTLISDEQVASA